MLNIERLQTPEWRRFKHLRLRALREAPDAFDSTLAEVLLLDDQTWLERVATPPTFLATHEGQDIGMVRCVLDDEGVQAHLISMWVASEFRRMGTGQQLVQAAIEFARSQNCERLVLDVADSNSAAIALYDDMGFKPTGETDVYPPPRTHITEHRRMLVL